MVLTFDCADRIHSKTTVLDCDVTEFTLTENKVTLKNSLRSGSICGGCEAGTSGHVPENATHFGQIGFVFHGDDDGRNL